MIDGLRESYREEASELLQQLEGALLELEADPVNAGQIDRVFRCMHTIKGSGAMFGFERISAFTHELENVYDQVRSQRLKVSPELISLTLSARDHIQQLLAAEFGGPPSDPLGEQRLLADLAALARQVQTRDRAAQLAATTYRIRFRPPADAFLKGTDPLLLVDALREIGPCTVTAQSSGIPPLEGLDLEHCYLSWDVVLSTPQALDDIRAVFLFVEDECELRIEALTPDQAESQAGPSPAEPDQKGRPEGEARKPEPASSIRVSSDKLDSLVNTVGELVTSQARLNRLAAAVGEPDLEFVAEEMERLIDRLRADAMSMRMLPIGSTFSRLRRLVRDLGKELGKQVEMTTTGAETELDKHVIEQLNDPLVHIIRNCIDHGIESPEGRLAAGKSPGGAIHLSAQHSGAHVLIRIADDGAGLDEDRIRRRAVERGLLAPDAEPTAAEIFRFIFEPGFSTANKVTGISGRGVGMDVVQKAVAALRGSVEVRSRRGEGTAFTLKLPLTLAIIDGLLVSVNTDYFVLPVSNVVECVELTRAERERAQGRHAVVVRNEWIPYLDLRESFGIAGEPPEISPVMLADTAYGKFGFVVDRVIGDHQTVIKSLGGVYRNVEAFSGATVLGDGSVALILDLDKLVKTAMMPAQSVTPAA